MQKFFGTWGSDTCVLFCYAPPDEAGAGAGEGTGDGGTNGAAAPPLVAAAAGSAAAGQGNDDGEGTGEGAQGDGNAAPPASYFPDGLADKYRGTNDRETLDLMAAELKDKPGAPDKPDGYELKLSDDMAKQFGDMKDDDVLPMWRDVAHELGLNQDQFNGAFEKLYTRMAEKGLIDDPVNVATELEALQPASGDPASKDAAAKQRVNSAVDWVQGQVERKVLTQDQASLVEGLAASAEGVKAIEALQRAAGEHGLQLGGRTTAGGDSKDGLLEIMKDPRYDLRGPKGDPRFVADVDKRWQNLHQ